VHKTFDLLRAADGATSGSTTSRRATEATYAMIRQADTVGTFQIESRAQMAMLPRLKPRCSTTCGAGRDRAAGPIQGDMVHPYLRRRNGEEPVTYPSEALREVFKRTLGVPLFQEQVMQLAIVAADYTPGEPTSCGVRWRHGSATAAWSTIGRKIIAGMLRNGYTTAFAEQIFEQIKGFGSYGLSGVACGELRVDRVFEFLAEVPRAGGFRRGLDQLAADGVLRAEPDRAGRAAAQRGRAAGRRALQRLGLHARSRSAMRHRNRRCGLGMRMVDGFPPGRCRAGHGRAGGCRSSSDCHRPVRARRTRCACARSARRCRCLRDLAGIGTRRAGRRRAWKRSGLVRCSRRDGGRHVRLPLPTRKTRVRTDYATTGLTLGGILAVAASAIAARRFRRSSELARDAARAEVAFAAS
jgi:error-prone DNA polymerase